MHDKSPSRPETEVAPDDTAAPHAQTIRDHIQSQVANTAAASPPTAEADTPSESGQRTTDQIQSAITAWVGVTNKGDAIEAMIAAQLVASQDLTMATIKRAIKRTTGPSHYGTSIIDACRIATLTLRQIETLSRYRTWKRQTIPPTLEQNPEQTL